MKFQHEEHRIYLNNESGDIIAEVTFPERAPGIYVINHTFVDDSLRGQGIASKLVQEAVDQIAARKGTVEATCSYAVHWLEKHQV